MSDYNYTEGGQRIVIDISGYSIAEGFAIRITLPSGKFFYVEVGSEVESRAKGKGLECKAVSYFGACVSLNINSKAHEGLPIQINEVSVADFIGKIATVDECAQFHA